VLSFRLGARRGITHRALFLLSMARRSLSRADRYFGIDERTWQWHNCVRFWKRAKPRVCSGAEEASVVERAFTEYLRDVCELCEMRVDAPLPLGAHQRGDGVNFAIFSREDDRGF